MGLVELARTYCRHYHAGQERKLTRRPYHVHPEEVADLLTRYGYADVETQCVALLHDLVEDTPVRIREIQERFGFGVAHGVYILSRNTITEKEVAEARLATGRELDPDQLYRLRIALTRDMVKRVKVADMVCNTRDLLALPDKTRAQKLEEAPFYIAIGRACAPLMVRELEENIARVG